MSETSEAEQLMMMRRVPWYAAIGGAVGGIIGALLACLLHLCDK